MSEVSAPTQPTTAAFDMKAGQFTIPTLVLRAHDLSGLDDFLARQVARLPDFFRQAPVAIDLSQLPPEQPFTELSMVVGILRGHGMIPVGVRGASEAHREQAVALELAVMPAGRKIPTRGTAATPTTPAASAGTLLVDKLVIGVAINRDKGPLFDLEERVKMVEAECASITRRNGVEIVAHPFENLLIDCARDVGASIIIRGLRAVAEAERT